MRRKLVLAGIACGVVIFTAIVALNVNHHAPASPEVAIRANEEASTSLPVRTASSAHSADTGSVQTYVFTATATGTVESLMKAKREDGSLTFTSKEYPTLGSFLESINGLRNAHGHYWLLYINDTFSSTGMSQATIRPGDRIKWHYEL